MAGGRRRLETREDFEAQWRHDMEFAERTILERGELVGMFVVHGRGGSTLQIVASWSSDETKRACYELVQLACVANDAVGVASMAEAWIVLGPDSLDVVPSRSDRRQECVVVSMIGRVAETGEQVGLVSVRRIERGPDGRVSGLTPMELPAAEEASGEIFEMLPPERPSGEARRKARAAMERIMKRMRRGKPPTVH